MSQQKNKSNKVLYFAGGIVFAASMFYVLPKIIDCASEYLYQQMDYTVQPLPEDWGPEIVRTKSLGEDKK